MLLDSKDQKELTNLKLSDKSKNSKESSKQIESYSEGIKKVRENL